VSRTDAREASWGLSRRLEELALNASGAPHSMVYDGWLLGYRPGPTKRLRSINPFYPSSFPLQQKIDYCVAFYAAARLPAIFRLLPFSQPPELERMLDDAGWGAFDRTLVMKTGLADLREPALPRVSVDLLELPAWVPLTVRLLRPDPEAIDRIVDRAAAYPLPQAGALVRVDDEVVACGLVKLEERYAGLFAVHTAEAWRGRGFARAIVAALLGEARKRGASLAYLQVTADNAPAMALYRHFGFIAAHEYWYRARDGERH
jgi:ribosomal protein S18 acetylase RimI-like enzyme